MILAQGGAKPRQSGRAGGSAAMSKLVAIFRESGEIANSSKPQKVAVKAAKI